MNCVFVSDLHGNCEKYATLFDQIVQLRPHAVFVGGDFMPSRFYAGGGSQSDFLDSFFMPELENLRRVMENDYPRIFLIMGNDDERSSEPKLIGAERDGLLEYLHGRKAAFGKYAVYGYACVPPTPFHLKDWERYDVSRYVDPGCVPPEEGGFSVPVDLHGLKYSTIEKDLKLLVNADDVENSIFLFHSPPYNTSLDEADLNEARIDGVPLDRHVGSIAIRNFIEVRQPLVTLHGHVHEAPRLSGVWREKIGRTSLFAGAHDGPELALIRFDPEDLDNARRLLL